MTRKITAINLIFYRKITKLKIQTSLSSFPNQRGYIRFKCIKNKYLRIIKYNYKHVINLNHNNLIKVMSLLKRTGWN